MTKRHEYSLDLSDFNQPGPLMTVAQLRLMAAQPTYANALAELMIEAYQGSLIMTTKRSRMLLMKSSPIWLVSVGDDRR